MRGAAWSTDGNIYAALDLKTLSRVSAAGGTPQPVASLGESSEHAQHSHRWPQILPGGGALLVTAGSNATAVVGTTPTSKCFPSKPGSSRSCSRGGYFGRYLPSGHLIYVHQETLFAVPFSPARLETQGMPVPILDDVAGANTNGAGQFDFSQAPSGHGTLIYLSGKNIGEAPPAVWLDAAGIKKPLWATPPGPLLSPRLSPDGAKLAVSLNREYLGLRSATRIHSAPELRFGDRRLSGLDARRQAHRLQQPCGRQRHLVGAIRRLGSAAIALRGKDWNGDSRLLYSGWPASRLPPSPEPTPAVTSGRCRST